MCQYILYDHRGCWLAQVCLTEDGMFSAVSEYGNFAFAWRSFGQNFKAFILSLEESYMAQKLESSVANFSNRKNAQIAALNFSNRILPVLKAAIKAELVEELKKL